jgi:hypothetical protein
MAHVTGFPHHPPGASARPSDLFAGPHPSVSTSGETSSHPGSEREDDDPVPPGLLLDLEEAFRVLEALEDARLTLRDSGAGPGLQDELATVIRIIHSRLGFDEGGAR